MDAYLMVKFSLTNEEFNKVKDALGVITEIRDNLDKAGIGVSSESDTLCGAIGILTDVLEGNAF